MCTPSNFAGDDQDENEQLDVDTGPTNEEIEEQEPVDEENDAPSIFTDPKGKYNIQFYFMIHVC